jgi:hypothetical protein
MRPGTDCSARAAIVGYSLVNEKANGEERAKRRDLLELVMRKVVPWRVIRGLMAEPQANWRIEVFLFANCVRDLSELLRMGTKALEKTVEMVVRIGVTRKKRKVLHPV